MAIAAFTMFYSSAVCIASLVWEKGRIFVGAITFKAVEDPILFAAGVAFLVRSLRNLVSSRWKSKASTTMVDLETFGFNSIFILYLLVYTSWLDILLQYQVVIKVVGSATLLIT